MTRALRIVVALVAFAATGCAAVTQMTAAPGDLADYRAWRIAAHPGARLARAEVYLAVHPDGAWAEEVRAEFTAEEPRFYEAAKSSRKGALEYLEYLPHGPHAEAAKALVDSFDESYEKAIIDRIVREVKHRAAQRREERERRGKLREAILADVALVLDPRVYGRTLAEAPDALRRALSGGRTPTIGWVPRHEEETLFFTVPSREGGEDRSTTVQLAVDVRSGVIVQGRVRGVDLFTAWTEADLGRVLDASSPDARAEAAAHVAALLGGAIESRLPQDRCEKASTRPARPGGPTFVLSRACDGWSATAAMGRKPGDIDEIAIRGMQAGP